MKSLNQKLNVIGSCTGRALQKCALLSITVILLIGAAPLSAQEEPVTDTEWGFELYGWMATIQSNTVNGDPILINFGTILKNLDMTAMLRGTVKKDRFFGAVDLIYLNIGDSQSHDGKFLGQPIEGKLEIGIESWVLNFLGGYHLIDNGTNSFGLLGGARYLDLTLDTTVKLEDMKRKDSVGDKVWDGVVGMRGRHNYPDGHYFRYYADVGGGGSKLTWQAQAEFAYDYKKFTGIIGYRYLKWNFKNDAKVMDDMKIHGPYLGIKWVW